MKHLLIALSLLTFSSIADSRIIDPQSCFRGPFESYSEWQKMLGAAKDKQFQAYFPKSKFVERKSNLECVDFTYQVDGLTIEGFYIKPKQVKVEKLPVVIFNRGGNARYGYVNFEKKMGFIADIATKGYVVVGSQYRGSSGLFIGNNGQDEYGGEDVNDVLALLPLIKEIPRADSSNVALMGWSRGAMQSYLAAKQMPKVKAIVAIAGSSDEESGLIRRPAMERVYKTRIPNFAANKEKELAKRSVIKWVDELPKSPILLIHGDNDKRVNVEQSRSLAKELSAKNHPHKLMIYFGDNHRLSNNRDKLASEIHHWLNQYL